MPTALITGAGRGIGLALAEAYAADDWTVIAGVRSERAADAVSRLDGDVVPVTLDVADPASVGILSARLSGLAIDLLINNAGVGDPKKPFGEIDFAAFQRVLEVNTISPVRIAEAFLEHLRQGEQKKIMTLSSQLGSIANNQTGGRIPYRASKAAVNASMRSIAHDLKGEGFTVNVFHPGWVATDMGGDQAPVSPAESAAGLKRLIDRLGPAESGRFFNYDGKELPW